MKRERETVDKMEYTSKTTGVQIDLHGVLMKCTSCGALKPASEVGMLFDGKVYRNQPQCRECR